MDVMHWFYTQRDPLFQKMNECQDKELETSKIIAVDLDGEDEETGDLSDWEDEDDDNLVIISIPFDYLVRIEKIILLRTSSFLIFLL